MLTALLATVAGLITHFDALAHAAGLSVLDKSVSGIIPLWVMTALRSVAVIGFLLASRLKNVSLNELRRELVQRTQQEPAALQESAGESTTPSIDYGALARALVTAMHQAGTVPHISVQEERAALPEPSQEECAQDRSCTAVSFQGAGTEQQEPSAEGERILKLFPFTE